MKYMKQKCHGLTITSKVNLNTSNKKGEIELDWSSYDTQNKYFVIYRKKEDEVNWETIVNIEQKYTGSSYIDRLANDKENPVEPNINIEEITENNNIQITAKSQDSGTKYMYYVESYDSNDISLKLNTSNILQ